jgi:hypothetical protein
MASPANAALCALIASAFWTLLGYRVGATCRRACSHLALTRPGGGTAQRRFAADRRLDRIFSADYRFDRRALHRPAAFFVGVAGADRPNRLDEPGRLRTFGCTCNQDRSVCATFQKSQYLVLH